VDTECPMSLPHPKNRSKNHFNWPQLVVFLLFPKSPTQNSESQISGIEPSSDARQSSIL